MTRQLISTNRQLLLRHVTRSVRRAAGFVQVRLEDMASDLLERRLVSFRGPPIVTEHRTTYAQIRLGFKEQA